MASFDHTDDDHLQYLDYDQLVAAVPYVRRLGYAVNLYSSEEESCPFPVRFPGQPYLKEHHDRRLKEFAKRGREYPIRLHGTSPTQIRRRGLLKSVPAMLSWLRRARIALADPSRPGAAKASKKNSKVVADRKSFLCSWQRSDPWR